MEVSGRKVVEDEAVKEFSEKYDDKHVNTLEVVTLFKTDEEDVLIELNVGGKKMSTLKSTITNQTDSLLARMITGDAPNVKDSSGRVFLDCDPETFRHVLDFMRCGQLPPRDKVVNVYECAKRFSIGKLVDALKYFKPVHYKRHADEARSKVDPEKYEKLKQNIFDQLNGSDHKSDIYFNIVSDDQKRSSWVTHQHNCPYNYNYQKTIGHMMVGGNWLPVNAKSNGPSISTDINLTEDNLIRALTEDFYQFGYGKLRYLKGTCGCQGYKFSYNYIIILISKKKEVKKLNELDQRWKSV